jgi:hypothetical protein
VDYEEALVADELWGWPIDVLDRLLELRRQAGRGEISIEEWRELDAAQHVGMPAIDVNEVTEFQTEVVVDHLDSSKAAPQLVGRLSVLAHQAPTDEELWDELAANRDHIAESKRDRRLRETLQNRRQRIIAWLTRPGSGIDPVTGLSWSQVARYRVVDLPGIGAVPQSVESARRLAVTEASDAERQRAHLLVETPERQPVAELAAELEQQRLTWLPRLILDAVDDDESLRPLLENLTNIWADPRVQRLLFAETARGWPPAAVDQESDNVARDA